MRASPSHANPGRVLTPTLGAHTQSLTSFPTIVSAAAAIQRLRAIRFMPAREAVAQLGVWQESSRILQLYRQYFPQEFARSTASTSVPIHHGEPGYSMRELEFFGRIDQSLFPLPSMLFDMERLPNIPVYPMGVDWEDERENTRLSLRAAMALVSDDDTMLWEAWLPPHLRPLSGERDWKYFAELCRHAKGLAVRFPLLLELVALDTGNLWLDASWDTSWDEYPWEEKAIEYLKNEWRKAQRIFAQLDPLLDRMDKHPRYWLTRLVKLWNGAIKVTARQNPSLA
ncbi:hypothetical protein ANRL1_00400 [Anaerolineae bacterium]|nr:hypothetical protein ANRL1_00400 [Anaerolineae bacterium]